MLDITFKENCLPTEASAKEGLPTVALAKEGPDIRNTKAIDIYRELREYDIEVDVYDPWANPAEVMHEYGIKTITEYPEGNGYGAIILAVAHNEFQGINLQLHKDNGCIIYDVKGILDPDAIDGRL